MPFLNTLILLSSGLTLTWSHRAILHSYRKDALLGLTLTIVLGFIFTFFQAIEYIFANFNINDSAYGAIFYLATGFHGVGKVVSGSV